MGYAKLVANTTNGGTHIGYMKQFLNLLTGELTSIDSTYWDPSLSYIVPSNSTIGNWYTYGDDWLSNTSVISSTTSDRMITCLYAPCANTSRPAKHVMFRMGGHNTTSTYTANAFANATAITASVQNANRSAMATSNNRGFILNAVNGRPWTSANATYNMFGVTGNTYYSEQSASNDVKSTVGYPGSGRTIRDANGDPTGIRLYETYRPLYGSNTVADANAYGRNVFGQFNTGVPRTIYVSWSERHIFFLDQVPSQSTSSIHAVFEHEDYEGSINANVSPLVAVHIPHCNTVTYVDYGDPVNLTTSTLVKSGPTYAKGGSATGLYQTYGTTVQILGGTVLNTYTAQTVLTISNGFPAGSIADANTETYLFHTYGDYSNTIQSWVRRDLGNGIGYTNLNLSITPKNVGLSLIGSSLSNNSIDFNFVAFPMWFTAPKLGANYINFSEPAKLYLTALNAMANDELVTIDGLSYRYVNNIGLGNYIYSGFLLPYF